VYRAVLVVAMAVAVGIRSDQSVKALLVKAITVALEIQTATLAAVVADMVVLA
jgi:hypothetical protein